MKKLIALFSLLCVIAMPFAVTAETTVPEINWADMEPIVKASEISGSFYSLSDMGLMFWVPDGLEPVEVSEEDAAAGRYALLMDEEKTCALSIDTLYMEGMTLDQAYENAVANGMKEPEIVTVNGIGTLSYTNEADDIGSIVLVDTNCNMIIFSFAPFSADGAEIVFSFIAASIMPLE
ncbi:MAG: hypothetical protein IK099_14610 [Clostridia bacterium]|nr:hypothetical protein [Clostridia bacterium]